MPLSDYEDVDARLAGARASLGTLCAERYRLDEVLGEGGMSIVYGAWDTLLERPVALKQLRLDRAAPPDTLVREAKTLAAVHHTNVVTVHALNADVSPPFLVMERVEGVTLDAYVRSKPPTLDRALVLLREIASGMDAIHEAGMVHGDVKPANVLVGADGHVKVADMGLVALLERMETGEVLGTPTYMPPERAMGAVPPKSLAPRSDVYSFAVLAFELLTRRLPFARGRTADLLASHATIRPPAVSEVSHLSSVFDEPIAIALSKNPRKRPERCGELVDALESARVGTDARGRRLRLLVVDDDSDHLALTSELVRVHVPGAEVMLEQDGDLALANLDRAAPTIAILDLAMPGLSGIELVRALRERIPDLAIIVITGHGSGKEWRELRALGVRRFIVKPVEVLEVVRAIREIADELPEGAAATAPIEMDDPRERVTTPGR